MFAAEIQSGTLIRSLLIAAVVVSPYAIHKIRQVRSARLAREQATTPGAEGGVDSGPRLEDVIARIAELGADMSLESATVSVPDGVTVDGDAAPAALIDTLVRDSLRRSGLVATAELDTAAGRVIEVRRSRR